MIDVHCHLNFKSFDKDVDAVIKRAQEKGVTTIINVGTQISSSKKAVELSEKYENLYAIVGVHPHHADKPDDNWLEELEKLAKHPKVVGIGEIGMDFYNYKSNGIVNPELQREVFIKQIELSLKLKLPLQIHNRQGGVEILKVIEQYKSELLDTPGMFHCMSGDLDFLKEVLDLGFYVGFDGNISYPGIAPGETTELYKLVEYAPLQRIVVETDSPFLPPEPYRGKRNEPSYAIIVGEIISRIKKAPFEEVEAVTEKNSKFLFKL